LILMLMFLLGRDAVGAEEHNKSAGAGARAGPFQPGAGRGHASPMAGAGFSSHGKRKEWSPYFRVGTRNHVLQNMESVDGLMYVCMCQHELSLKKQYPALVLLSFGRRSRTCDVDMTLHEK